MDLVAFFLIILKFNLILLKMNIKSTFLGAIFY